CRPDHLRPAGRGLARRPDQRPTSHPGDGGRLPAPDRRVGVRGMSELLLRDHVPDAAGLVHRVTPASAGWTYVGFELWRLLPGQSLAQATGEREACLVIVG